MQAVQRSGGFNDVKEESAFERLPNESEDVSIEKVLNDIDEDRTEVGSQTKDNLASYGLAYRGPKDFNNFLPPLAWVTPNHRNFFIHEVAHLFGCSHDTETHLREGNQLTNNSNHGYYVKGTRWATIMAYRTVTHNQWIPFFSNKVYTRHGRPLGDAKHDNRNQIMKTRFLVSQYGDESGTCKNPR